MAGKRRSEGKKKIRTKTQKSIVTEVEAQQHFSRDLAFCLFVCLFVYSASCIVKAFFIHFSVFLCVCVCVCVCWYSRVEKLRRETRLRGGSGAGRKWCNKKLLEKKLHKGNLKKKKKETLAFTSKHNLCFFFFF